MYNSLYAANWLRYQERRYFVCFKLNEGFYLAGYKLLPYICIMSKNKRNTYRKVSDLPINAMKVADYAAQWPCNTSYIYKMVSDSIKKNKSLTFEIVDFHGINFVLS